MKLTAVFQKVPQGSITFVENSPVRIHKVIRGKKRGKT